MGDFAYLVAAVEPLLGRLCYLSFNQRELVGVTIAAIFRGSRAAVIGRIDDPFLLDVRAMDDGSASRYRFRYTVVSRRDRYDAE